MKYNIKFYNRIKKILKIIVKLFFNPKIEGLENLPNKPYILAGNHKSMFDIVLLISSIPNEIHFMAKKELFDKKILSNIFSKMGAFSVDRGNKDTKALKTSFEILRSGEVLGIFPEGTRNRTNEILLPFKRGVSNIANETESLIVPFGISGNYRRYKIKLNIGKPINIKQIDKEKQTKYIEDKVKQLILK